MSSTLELYQEILFTKSMLEEILDGVTGIFEVDHGYINSNAPEFRRLEQDKVKLFNSLGENAKRLLEIGIVQDELEKLGFKRTGAFTFDMIRGETTVSFLSSYAVIGFNVLHYNSPTWRQDIINQVK